MKKQEDRPSILAAHPELQEVPGMQPGPPAHLRVVQVERCFWGYAVTNLWEIDPTGQIVPKLCRVAMEPVENARVLGGQERRRIFTCSCPLRGNQVTFELDQNEAAS